MFNGVENHYYHEIISIAIDEKLGYKKELP